MGANAVSGKGTAPNKCGTYTRIGAIRKGKAARR